MKIKVGPGIVAGLALAIVATAACGSSAQHHVGARVPSFDSSAAAAQASASQAAAEASASAASASNAAIAAEASVAAAKASASAAAAKRAAARRAAERQAAASRAAAASSSAAAASRAAAQPTQAAPAQPPAQSCTPGYDPCIAPGPDVDCRGGSGNGPRYVDGPIRVTGSDPYGLDSDHDGIGCE